MDSAFDYSAPAELFAASHRSRRASLRYHRFDTSAEAIKFAVEALGADGLNGTVMEVAEVRFGRDEISSLYSSLDFPLPRKARVSA